MITISIFFDDGHFELYHLKKDPGEKNNLAEINRAKTEELKKELEAWRQEVGAKK